MMFLITLCSNNKMFYFLVFFFSSRRRHTRSKRDWSSDVCSSDLFFFTFNRPRGSVHLKKTSTLKAHGDVDSVQATRLQFRSEERRVGKECRFRWLQEH